MKLIESIIVKALCFSSVFLISPAYSWTPCTPFCDVGCTGVAVNSMMAQAASGYANAAAGYQNLSGQIISSNTNTLSFGQDVTTNLIDNHRDVVAGWDAYLKTVALTIEKEAVSTANSTDASIGSSINLTKGYLSAQWDIELDRNFNTSITQPIDGVVGANRAATLKIISVKKHQLIDSNNRLFGTFLTEDNIGNKKIDSLLLASIVEDNAEELVALSNNDSISLDGIEAINKVFFSYLKYGVNNSPNTLLNNSNYENIKSKLLVGFLQEVLHERAMLGGNEWMTGHVTPVPNDAVSMSTALSAPIEGRHLSEEWFSEKGSASPAGLYRDLVYMSREGLATRARYNAVKSKLNTLRALDMAEALRKAKVSITP